MQQVKEKQRLSSVFRSDPVLCISPFNFPLNLALHKIGPALAAGCSFILKPAPQAPLSALAFAELCIEAGLPAGVANILLCDIPEAERIVKDRRLKLLSFTGSPKVGWYLKEICGMKKVALELGGNAAALISDSADLDLAISKLIPGSFLYSGQICISTQRIYVHKGLYSAFLDKFLPAVDAVSSGDPLDPQVINGPVIDNSHLNRIDEWVQEAVAEGARILTGGKVLSSEHNLYAPTVITNTQTGMKVLDDEVFGPVVVVEKVDNFEKGVDAVNQSIFGLQAGVFTNNLEEVKYAMDHVEVAGLMINNIPGFRVDGMPYGGVKASGFGREGIKYTMEDMTEGRLIVF